MPPLSDEDLLALLPADQRGDTEKVLLQEILRPQPAGEALAGPPRRRRPTPLPAALAAATTGGAAAVVAAAGANAAPRPEPGAGPTPASTPAAVAHPVPRPRAVDEVTAKISMDGLIERLARAGVDPQDMPPLREVGLRGDETTPLPLPPEEGVDGTPPPAADASVLERQPGREGERESHSQPGWPQHQQPERDGDREPDQEIVELDASELEEELVAARAIAPGVAATARDADAIGAPGAIAALAVPERQAGEAAAPAAAAVDPARALSAESQPEEPVERRAPAAATEQDLSEGISIEALLTAAVARAPGLHSSAVPADDVAWEELTARQDGLAMLPPSAGVTLPEAAQPPADSVAVLSPLQPSVTGWGWLVAALSLALVVATAVGLLWLRGRSLREQERQRASKLAAAEELRRELAAASEAGASSVLARKLVPACPGEMAMVVGPPTFCVDRHEYPGPGRLPQTRISLGEAQALCRARGAALCSEAQWRQACEGPERTLYCYGPQHELGRCNLGERGQAAGPLRAAGALAGCQSAAGVFDLHGNAAEWVAEGLVKGGSARSDETAATCVGAQRPEPEQRSEWVGFRCCAPLSAVAR